MLHISSTIVSGIIKMLKQILVTNQSLGRLIDFTDLSLKSINSFTAIRLIYAWKSGQLKALIKRFCKFKPLQRERTKLTQNIYSLHFNNCYIFRLCVYYWFLAVNYKWLKQSQDLAAWFQTARRPLPYALSSFMKLSTQQMQLVIEIWNCMVPSFTFQRAKNFHSQRSSEWRNWKLRRPIIV